MSKSKLAEPENQELSELIDSSFREFKEGSIVMGTIIEIRPQVILVDIGYKSEGTIAVSEFEDEEIEVGDEVEARLTNVNRKDRTLTISIKAMELADQREAMKSVNESTEAESTDFGPTSIGALIKQQMGGE